MLNRFFQLIGLALDGLGGYRAREDSGLMSAPWRAFDRVRQLSFQNQRRGETGAYLSDFLWSILAIKPRLHLNLRRVLPQPAPVADR